jgi:hypothetical protein
LKRFLLPLLLSDCFKLPVFLLNRLSLPDFREEKRVVAAFLNTQEERIYNLWSQGSTTDEIHGELVWNLRLGWVRRASNKANNKHLLIRVKAMGDCRAKSSHGENLPSPDHGKNDSEILSPRSSRLWKQTIQ